MKGLLNGEVRLVMLQFSFNNIRAVPPELFEKKEKVDHIRVKVQGTQFLAPIENVSVAQFLPDLTAVGYPLVDAFYQTCNNDRGQEYPVVRFVSVAEDSIRSGEFDKHRIGAIKAFARISQEALWRAQGFLNPFFQEGKIVDGAYAISINLVARNPLVDGDGKPILRWRKDDEGKRLGDGPVPIEPKLFLRIDKGDIRVVSA